MLLIFVVINYAVLIAAMVMGYQGFEDKYGDSYAIWLVSAPLIAGLLGFRLVSAFFSLFLYYGVYLFFTDVNAYPLLSTLALYAANFSPIFIAALIKE